MKQVNSDADEGHCALVALGSNATSRHGTPRETIEKALAALDGDGLRVVAKSRLYLTPFIPLGQGADVVNAVALLQTDLSPADLLAHLHAIEAAFDRTRGERWRDRTLDLDLIAFGDRVLPDRATLDTWMALPMAEQKRRTPDGLILPHPRLQDRAFVLVPAADVAPDWVHPITGRTIAEMRAALPAGEIASVAVLKEEG